jgi:hypothetical protein
MRSWLRPAPRRTVEALADQVIPTGAMMGSYGRDPIDGDIGYRAAGRGTRDVPLVTREKARDYSIAAYRSNPMATAVIDTIVSFCVGDSGVTWQSSDPKVAEVVREFWDDPRNRVGHIQEPWLRSQLLAGECLTEMLVGANSGVVRFSPVEVSLIRDVRMMRGNPLWPDEVVLPAPGQDADPLSGMVSPDSVAWKVVQVDDESGLRDGKAMFWAPWKTLITDTRGYPFLMPILDWLDNYDSVLSNLIDRTALMRHLAYSVKVGGDWPEVNAYVERRGGIHVPPSGTVEFHTDDIEWKPISAQTGAMEDTVANAAVLTNIASGAGLSKIWLSEPDGANRATSQSMAEPVRRRVGGIQNGWIYQQNELVRFVVDRAVASGRIPAEVEGIDPRSSQVMRIPASQAVLVTGPKIAAADAQFTAQVLLNLSTGLEKLQQIGALSKEHVQMAAEKAWEAFAGIPYNAELAKSYTDPDDVATAIEDAKPSKESLLRLVGGRTL